MEMETSRTKTMIEENQVTISGKIASNFGFSHEIYGEGFYTVQLESERESGTADIIPIMVSERLVNVKEDWMGQHVKISGQFRSYNQHEENRNRLKLSVFAREFEAWEDDGTTIPTDKNSVFLDGYICKQPTYRKTPFDREISDILLAVNRPYGKSDYIPIICWGRNARFASGLVLGARLKVWGRIQSREYCKKIEGGEYETRTAYEVSVWKMEIMEKARE